MSAYPQRLFAAAVLLSLGAFTATVEPARGAGLLIADGGFGGVLEIQQHDVRVTINNGVAVTEVTQVFANTEDRVVEALYTFPVPKGASVSNFSMWINGKEMVGEVVEKELARQIYNSYKQRRRDPGLLEQVNYKRFEMRIFPIPARAEQKVQVTYYQELDFDHDWATYVYPLATVTRSDLSSQTAGKFSFTLEAKNAVPIVAMESPSHGEDFVTVAHTENYQQASLETTAVDLNRDLVIAYQQQRPHTGIDLIASKQPQEEGYFLLTLTAGEELTKHDMGMDFVFVLDISGSMGDDGKLRISRNSLGAFIDSLGNKDRFEVMTFNIAPQVLFRELTEASDETREQAKGFLDSQLARGGTVLRGAMAAAYRYKDADRTLNVVVLSDGMTQQAEQRELLQLIGQRPSGSRVFCIGVGNEVNRPLLSQLADDAGGLAAFISRGDDFQRQAQAFRRKLMRPAATNLQIRLDGCSVFDVEPQVLPNLYHGAPLRLYGRYRDGGALAITVEADIEGAPLDQTVNIELPKVEHANPQIERMWAWHRVQRLLNESRQSGAKALDRGEIVRLCEGYSIVSEYASFLVLENDAEYQRWKIDRRNAARITRDRRALAQLHEQLAKLQSQTGAELGPNPTSGPGANSLARNSATAPSATPQTASSPAAPVRRSASAPAQPGSRNLDFSPGAGGGAIDPISGALALGLAGAAASASWRRRRKKS